MGAVPSLTVSDLPSSELAKKAHLCAPKSADRKPRRSLLSRFRKAEEGTAAVEFAMVALPFFMLLGFIAELGISYFANKVLSFSVDNVSRQIRVGTFDLGVAAGADASTRKAAFQAQLCNQFGMEIFFECDKLIVDVRTVASWADRPSDPAREEEATDDDGNVIFDSSGNPILEESENLYEDNFDVAPGGRLTINVVRVYYDWPTLMDFNKSQSRTWMNGKRLMSSSSAFLNEPF